MLVPNPCTDFQTKNMIKAMKKTLCRPNSGCSLQRQLWNTYILILQWADREDRQNTSQYYKCSNQLQFLYVCIYTRNQIYFSFRLNHKYRVLQTFFLKRSKNSIQPQFCHFFCITFQFCKVRNTVLVRHLDESQSVDTTFYL